MLGAGETCTGDPARRSGNEFLFQTLAMENVETLNEVFDGREPGTRKIVVTCAHCFNALGNEYPQLGGQYEVVHHTQLLNRLVREKRLVPVQRRWSRTVTYHDPCYLGRHNKVYDAPRELVGASGATLTEMPRHAERALCCGAGGARMWMEERIGKRINLDRVDEALSTKPAKIATGCPFCRVMLTDGLGARQDTGAAPEEVEVIDVAQLLLASVRRSVTQPAEADPMATGHDLDADTPTDEVASGTPLPERDDAPDARQSATQPADAGPNSEVASNGSASPSGVESGRMSNPENTESGPGAGAFDSEGATDNSPSIQPDVPDAADDRAQADGDDALPAEDAGEGAGSGKTTQAGGAGPA